jgi:CheY-like chemotaxis protein
VGNFTEAAHPCPPSAYVSKLTQAIARKSQKGRLGCFPVFFLVSWALFSESRRDGYRLPTYAAEP